MAKGQVKQKQTPETLKKLDEVFAIDGTVEEACYYADISPALYYVWVKDNPELLDRFTRLRERPVLLARQTAIKFVNQSYANAIDYLSRKRKKEFATRSELTGAGGEAIQIETISPEDKAKLLALL